MALTMPYFLLFVNIVINLKREGSGNPCCDDAEVMLNTYKSFNFCSLNTANHKVLCTLRNILFNVLDINLILPVIGLGSIIFN